MKSKHHFLNAAPSNLVKVLNTGSKSKLSGLVIIGIFYSHYQVFHSPRILGAKKEVPYPAKFGGWKCGEEAGRWTKHTLSLQHRDKRLSILILIRNGYRYSYRVWKHIMNQVLRSKKSLEGASVILSSYSAFSLFCWRGVLLKLNNYLDGITPRGAILRSVGSSYDSFSKKWIADSCRLILTTQSLYKDGTDQLFTSVSE